MRMSLPAIAVLMTASTPFTALADNANEVTNLQLNDADIFSSLNVEVKDISGELSATSAAIANSFSAELGGSTTADILQNAAGNVNSRLDVSANNFDGAVDLTSAAIANSASVSVEGGDFADITSIQSREAAFNPHAALDFSGSGVGEVSATAAAISNSLSVSTLPSTVNTNVNLSQSNLSNLTAEANLVMRNTGGVNATAAAIGNSASISNLLKDD